jgi:beta-lactamase superfamily II metal-dependent hydrolase
MRWVIISILSMAVALAAPTGRLKINFIDVEGGQATLFVLPSGESLLVDAGWPTKDSRDAHRIVAAAQSCGLTKIDYLLVTHYHLDHVGGVPQLAAAFPIGTLIDHGPNNETDAGAKHLEAEYQKVIASGVKRLVVKPGDVLPLKGARIEIVTANGERIRGNVAGGGQPNPACDGMARRPVDTSENARSVGFVLTFGKFRAIDLGDLTWNKELDLVCPLNAVGPVDLLVVSHHGWSESGSKALVYALHPRVAVMDNGARKGGGQRPAGAHRQRRRALPGPRHRGRRRPRRRHRREEPAHRLFEAVPGKIGAPAAVYRKWKDDSKGLAGPVR